MTKLCPKCGALDSQKEFVGAFCAGCYARHERVFEPLRKPEIRQCRSCKRAFLGSEWTALDEQSLGEWIASKLKSKLALREITVSLGKAKNGLFVHAKLCFDGGSGKIVRETNFLVRVEGVSCDECHKRSGGYHEAIVQVRGEDKERVKRVAEKIAKIASSESFVSGWEEKKEGIDIQIGAKRAAKQAVAETEKPFTITHKLIGMKEGKRVFRATLCVRV